MVKPCKTKAWRFSIGKLAAAMPCSRARTVKTIISCSQTISISGKSPKSSRRLNILGHFFKSATAETKNGLKRQYFTIVIKGLLFSCKKTILTQSLFPGKSPGSRSIEYRFHPQLQGCLRSWTRPTPDTDRHRFHKPCTDPGSPVVLEGFGCASFPGSPRFPL